MLNRAKAIEVLSKNSGTWVSYKNRQVTKWDSVHPYECEAWEDGYSYFETDNLEEALRFLESAI